MKVQSSEALPSGPSAAIFQRLGAKLLSRSQGSRLDLFFCAPCFQEQQLVFSAKRLHQSRLEIRFSLNSECHDCRDERGTQGHQCTTKITWQERELKVHLGGRIELQQSHVLSLVLYCSTIDMCQLEQRVQSTSKHPLPMDREAPNSSWGLPCCSSGRCRMK